MPRTINTSTANALNQKTQFHGLFAELDFPGGAVRAWSGYGDQPLNGDVFLGVGTLGTFSGVTQEERISANNSIVQLNGVPSDLLSLIFREDYRGRPAKIWRSLFDESGIIGDPMLIECGKMDVATIEDGKDSGTISISIENRLVDFSRPRERRLTHEDQKARYPNDLGLEYMASLQEKELPWGRESNNVNNTSGSGSSSSSTSSQR